MTDKHMPLRRIAGLGRWRGWRRVMGWCAAIGALALLGSVRVATNAEFAFASMAILPVLLVAWFDGPRGGLVVAILAAAMWTLGDLTADRERSAVWVPWINGIARAMTYGLVAMLAAELQGVLMREHTNASHDPLTGLLNRRAFLDAGAVEVRRAARYGHAMALMYLDLDEFKQLNDTLGHAVGDQALQAAARTLMVTMRDTDRVARLGGDEFAVLLPETSYEATVEAGKRVMEALNDRLATYSPVSTSIGVAWYARPDRDFVTMLNAADGLMYSAKHDGKGRIRTQRITGLP